MYGDTHITGIHISRGYTYHCDTGSLEHIPHLPHYGNVGHWTERGKLVGNKGRKQSDGTNDLRMDVF